MEIIMNINILFSNVLERMPKVAWRGIFKDPRQLKGLLLRVSLVVTNRLTSEYGIASFIYAKKVIQLTRSRGLLSTALYLKQCSVLLQQYYSEHDNTGAGPMKVWVSLTRCGLPRIIPAFHRRIIRGRGVRGDRIVRMWISWLQIYRIIELAPKVSANTFKSIISPCDNIQRVLNVAYELKEEFHSLIKDYMPWVSTIPLNQGIEWKPTWKSLPNSDLDTASRFVPSKIEGGKPVKVRSNCFSSLKYELAAYSYLEQISNSLEGMWSPGLLWIHRVRYAMDPKNRDYTNQDLSWYEDHVGPVLASIGPALKESGFLLKFGRLACAVEGGGKRRLFAIGNYVKQRLLWPYHSWLMKVLKRLPNDGTFNQERPLSSLINKSELFSFDLSAATDRWPLTIMYHVFMMLFEPSLASSVVNSTLGYNTFMVSRSMVKRPSEVQFVCGQPLGYYASWPLFALSHHFVVWLAARRAGASYSPYLYGCFRAYAVLGDDVVIADRRVADHYSNILGELGVVINKSKSLVSKIGGFEFAKRFYVRGQNLSPVSVRSLLMSRTTRGLLVLADKYAINFATLARLGGHGYRALGRLYHKRSKKLERLWLGLQRPRCGDPLLLDEWFGRGSRLNPYLKGVIVDFLRRKLKVKELHLIPDELVFDGELEILERTCIRNWMSQWLEWLKWYHTVAMAFDPTLQDLLFGCPVVETTWYRRDVDQTLVRFGYLWKIHDIITKLGVSWVPGILEPSGHPLAGWIRGGEDGLSFLMDPGSG
nr:CeaMV1-RdRp [Duamitovirus sp.]